MCYCSGEEERMLQKDRDFEFELVTGVGRGRDFPRKCKGQEAEGNSSRWKVQCSSKASVMRDQVMTKHARQTMSLEGP